MKRLIYFGLLLTLPSSSFAQSKALNIAGIHQLVDASKSENRLQNEARNRQSVTTVNEEYNKTLLGRLKGKYRELQQRYQTLGTVLSAASLGSQAYPMLSRIISNQTEIYRVAEQNPIFLTLAYQTELEFAAKARSLVNYLLGLTASIGAVNQMKASDRKVLFDHVLFQLSVLQDLSNNLLSTIQYSVAAGAMRSLNPFQGYIDQDKAIVQDIIRNVRNL